MGMKARCEVKGCGGNTILGYAAFGSRRNKEVGVCEYHWEKHCDDEDEFDLPSYFYPSGARIKGVRGVRAK